MSDTNASQSGEIVTLPAGPSGGDPLVQEYLDTNLAVCAFRVFSWSWLAIGLLGTVAGGVIGNRIVGTPLPPPDWAAMGSPVFVLHTLLGRVEATVVGMALGGLVTAVLGRLRRPHGIAAAHEPLLVMPLVILLYLATRDHLIALCAITGLICLIYLGAIVFRLFALGVAGRVHGLHVDDLHEPDEGWPVYTILVPLYRETAVAEKILRSIRELDYPPEKLDVKLMLEADDPDTVAAVRAAGLPGHVEAVIVPDANPKTKPRACNHGLRRARGEFLVIYDAEDRPEPDQLKQAVLAYRQLEEHTSAGGSSGRALGWLFTTLGALLMLAPLLTRWADVFPGVTASAVLVLVGLGLAAYGVLLERAFRRKGPVACLQAQLAYHNHAQNLLTRWFALEYNVWFRRYLPGLVRLGGPIPLGGTSNHFRTRVLHELDGWDPFNVTEDCDLGIRLYMAGYRTEVLDSITWEEANSRLGNWIRQRSRWLKGYLITHFVWCRRPAQLVRRLGPWGTFAFFVSIFGVGGLAILNVPLWIGLFAYLVLLAVDMGHGYGLIELLTSRGDAVSAHDRLSWQMYFSGPDQDPLWSSLSIVFFWTSVTLLAANLLFVFINLVYGARRGQRGLMLPAMLTPFYWVLISIGAWKGLWQMVVRPHYWEKTVHGLDEDE